MGEASAASEDSAAGTGPKLNGSKGKGLGTKGIISIIMVAALLVAIPLGYLVLTSEDEAPPEDEEEEETTDFAVLVTGKTSESELNLTDLQGMTYVEAVSSYQNRFLNYRGLGTYGGVHLRDIADLVGGMAPGDIMTIEGSDGYVQNLSYYQVYPDAEYLAIQGKSILSYKFNGTAAPDWEDGPMIAILAPDQAYSNADFNATCARDPEFLTSTSASSIWVRNVANITISEKYDEWSIMLEDLDGTEKVLTRTKFVWLAFSFGDYYVDPCQRNWSGVPVENVLGLVDDDDPSTFNETLAAGDYMVNVSATDGHSRTLSIDHLTSDTCILADRLNGTVLGEDYAPLRLVGLAIVGEESVSQIASITMESPEVEEEAVVTVIGKTSTSEVSMSDLEELEFIEGVTSYQNSYGNWRGLGTYGGVLLRDLANLVGGMVPGDVMTITATDGYWQNYSYYQVYEDEEYAQILGNVILAYEFNGTSIPEWENGPMVAILAPDQAFSNEDFNATADRDPEYQALSASALFAKHVHTIKISPLYDEWYLTLTDLEGESVVLPRTKYVTLDYWFGEFYVDSVLRNWSGAPLTSVLGLIDDDDPKTFNATLAATNYTVNVSSADGYYKIMSIEYLLADTCILAYKLNDTDLDEDYAPLKLTGPALLNNQRVSQVASIILAPLPEVVLTVQCDDVSIDFTMDEVEGLASLTSLGGFIKTTGAVVGPYEYTGVRLTDLIGLVSDVSDYSVQVTATDGYSMVYSYYQAHDGTFAFYDESGVLQGTGNFAMIVAYAQDGLPLVDMDLRIAIVDETAPITDGHFWAKYVRTITVLPVVREYTLNLSGLWNMTMDRQTFEGLASCEYHQVSYTFVNETGTHVYSGVALWVLVSAVDGADGPDTEYLFNDLLAQAGYNVTVQALDLYSKTFSSIKVARNDTLVVANRLDGQPLPDDQFPLRLVGAGLTSGQKVSMIGNITLTDIKDVDDWTVWLNGTRSIQMSAETFAATYYGGLHGPYFNYSDYGDWHAAYYNYTDGLVDHCYAGIPLWVLISCVDGVDLFHYQFNETLAEAGYTVKITASDGYSVTFTSAEIMYNNTLVIAFMWDGEPLPEDEAPLRLVGQWLRSPQMVSQIVSIELIGV
jgi:DMSO/TMAO reductase YedYZ molybdopterin-dependent catalytic subunit